MNQSNDLLERAVLPQVSYQGQTKMIAKAAYPELAAFLSREAQISGQQLRSLPDFVDGSGYYYPCFSGEVLYDQISKGRVFTKVELDAIFQQLVVAAYSLHKIKLLGRCLTTKNIVYHEGKITLLVFGFYPRLQYIPPEFHKEKTYSQQIDVWLIGVIMLQLLTGQCIDSVKTYQQCEQLVARAQRLPPPQEQDRKCSVQAMLELQPRQRSQFQILCNRVSPYTLQSELKSFYQNTFYKLSFHEQIASREKFDDDYFAWAVPREHEGKLGRLPQLVPNSLAEDLSFLPFSNCYREEQRCSPKIWQELHFLFYRNRILTHFNEQLDRVESNPNIVLSKYFLQKMNLLLIKEILDQLENNVPLIDVNPATWETFLASSRGLARVRSQIQGYLERNLNILGYTYQSTLQEMAHFQLDIQEQELFNIVKRSITGTISETSFQDLKIPYRRTLKFFYDQFQLINENTMGMQVYSKILFLAVCSMTINNIFTTNRDEILTVVRSSLKIPKVIQPCQIETFLKQATIEELVQQSSIILNHYF